MAFNNSIKLDPSLLKFLRNHYKLRLYHGVSFIPSKEFKRFHSFLETYSKREKRDIPASCEEISLKRSTRYRSDRTSSCSKSPDDGTIQKKGRISCSRDKSDNRKVEAINEVSEVSTTTEDNHDDASFTLDHKTSKRKSVIRVASRHARKPWTADEEEALYTAVMKHGLGNWAIIVEEGTIPGRSNVDLKDKWRWLEKKGHLNRLKTKLSNSKT